MINPKLMLDALDEFATATNATRVEMSGAVKVLQRIGGAADLWKYDLNVIAAQIPEVAYMLNQVRTKIDEGEILFPGKGFYY